jgi:phosphoglycolate phosphatase-like HAD superfamily hydrolase
MMAHSLQGMIFDVDGTLIDSNHAHAAAWSDALTEFGFPGSLDEVRPLIGMGGDKLIGKLTDLDPQGAQAKDLMSWRLRRFQDVYLPGLRPFPAVRALFERLQQDGVRRGIASSAKRDELTPLLEIAGIAGLIDEVVSSDDAHASKPDADILLTALHRLRCSAHDVRVVGDTPYDVQAATRAKIGIIAVRCGGWDDGNLVGAEIVLEDPAALLTYYEETWRPAT